MSKPAHHQFEPGDQVTVRTGKTVYAVLEVYDDRCGVCLTLSDGRNSSVELQSACRPLRTAITGLAA